MRFMPESKINAVNELAELICREMCGSDNCGLCQLANLSSGIDMALGDKMPVEEVKGRQTCLLLATTSKSGRFIQRRIYIEGRSAALWML